MSVYVFLGPTLPRDDAAELLDAVYLPPVAQGDVARIVGERPDAIAIVDGYFENVPSVWHKEILYALSQRIPVYGASSMGALRAAELHPFGMIGVGAVFEAYRDGRLEDDDEVAVIHGPPELGYPALSEAMVNIRRTLADAVGDGVVGAGDAGVLERIAKGLPYRERSYGRLLRLAGSAGVESATLARLKAWLPQGLVDQKREDAVRLLKILSDMKAESMPPVRFHFERTTLWERSAGGSARQ